MTANSWLYGQLWSNLHFTKIQRLWFCSENKFPPPPVIAWPKHQLAHKVSTSTSKEQILSKLSTIAQLRKKTPIKHINMLPVSGIFQPHQGCCLWWYWWWWGQMECWASKMGWHGLHPWDGWVGRGELIFPMCCLLFGHPYLFWHPGGTFILVGPYCQVPMQHWLQEWSRELYWGTTLQSNGGHAGRWRVSGYYRQS